MIKSKLIPIYTRLASVARFPLTRQYRTATALVLLLSLGGGLAPGGAMVHAQEASQTSAPTTVNINSADADTLASALQGVGQSRALEIVRYREAYGPFSAVEELADVKGIGQSTLDKNMQVITLD